MTAELFPGGTATVPGGGHETPAKATASTVLTALRRHYIRDERVPAGIFAAEIEAPGGGRRADLIWQGVTRAAGSELVGHEVKVNRSDLLVELADPAKSDPWQRYCHRWWVVVPHPALIDGLDLPPSWGVMALPTRARARAMVVVRDAPKLNPDEQSPALRALAARMHWELRDVRAEVNTAHERADRMSRAIDEMREQAVERAHTPATKKVIERIVRELGHSFYDETRIVDDKGGRVDVDTVIAALRDVQVATKARDDADRTHRHTVASLARLHGELERTLAGHR